MLFEHYAPDNERTRRLLKRLEEYKLKNRDILDIDIIRIKEGKKVSIFQDEDLKL